MTGVPPLGRGQRARAYDPAPGNTCCGIASTARVSAQGSRAGAKSLPRSKPRSWPPANGKPHAALRDRCAWMTAPAGAGRCGTVTWRRPGSNNRPFQFRPGQRLLRLASPRTGSRSALEAPRIYGWLRAVNRGIERTTSPVPACPLVVCGPKPVSVPLSDPRFAPAARAAAVSLRLAPRPHRDRGARGRGGPATGYPQRTRGDDAGTGAGVLPNKGMNEDRNHVRLPERSDPDRQSRPGS
jgi:hypothetical protein